MLGLVGFSQLFFLLFFCSIWFPLIYSQRTFWNLLVLLVNILFFINKKKKDVKLIVTGEIILKFALFLAIIMVPIVYVMNTLVYALFFFFYVFDFVGKQLKELIEGTPLKSF